MCMKKYDVFISYKHIGSDGNVTEDFSIGKELYTVLTQRGFSAFFSDETLFLLGRSNYKKAIDKALDSAKILIVIGTKQEYLLSGWVEYEYETFYEDILSKRKENANIISYTKNIPQSQLPRTLARQQNFPVTSIPPERVADYISNALCNNTEHQDTTSILPQYTTIEVSPSERRSSVYTSDYRNELSRLKIQATNSTLIDKQAISYVYDAICKDNGEKLNILDVGSAYGFVAADRFGNDARTGKILCIDHNERVIERAQILFADHEKLIFEAANVKSDTFVDDICRIMKSNGIEKIHVVFSALTLHHLKNPSRALRKLRNIMDRGSYIILRGSDDGSKLCYPKYELMESIIEMTAQVSGVSDRFNGRKIYSQLLNSGFSDIKMFSTMKDLSQFDFDDRSLLFQESFAYRVNYFYKAVEADPEDETAKRNLLQMQKYLDEFENLFFEKGFWYCEYDYAGVARKN